MNFTGFPPSDKTMVGVQEDTLDRISRLERRRAMRRDEMPGYSMPGVLDAAYRIGGPAKVKVGGLDAPLTGPYNWRTPYVPNQSRVVSMVRTFGDEWEIVGQTEASPLGKFVPLVLGANWRVYSTVTSDPAWGWRVGATKLPSGLVSLTGLVRTMAVPVNNQLIGTITDPDLWPEYDIAHSVEYGNTAVGITIKTDGRILTRFAGGSGVDFLSLSGVNYWAAESDATGNWKNVGTNCITFDSHYADWGDPLYGFSALYKDRWGFVWGRGLVRTVTPQTTNFPMINLPVGYRPEKEQHYRAISDNGFGFLGAGNATSGPNSINYKTGSPNAAGTWTSLAGIRVSTPDVLTLNSWTTPGLFLNSWANYNAVTFPGMTWTRREDGLVLFRGLITGGALGAAVTNLLATPEIFIRPKGAVFAAVGADVRTRVDISGDTYNQTIAPLSGGVAWVSLDNIQYLP
jgi:hypothetical protein